MFMADKEIPLIRATKTAQKNVLLDPNGFFVIELDRNNKDIRVEYYSNVYKNKKIVSGVLETVFLGKKADELCDTIEKNVILVAAMTSKRWDAKKWREQAGSMYLLGAITENVPIYVQMLADNPLYWGKSWLAGVPLLTDDYAPVDTLRNPI